MSILHSIKDNNLLLILVTNIFEGNIYIRFPALISIL